MAKALTLADSIERFEQARDELREVVREAHAVVKDLRAATVEAAKMRDAVTQGAQAAMEAAVEKNLEETAESFKKFTNTLYDSVIENFTSLANQCLYGNSEGTGGTILELLSARYAKVDRQLSIIENELRARR